MNCVNCGKNIVDVPESKFCEECREKLVKCRFSENGCLFVDVNSDKCKKHEKYFCPYQTDCYLCGVKFSGDVSFIEHLQSSSFCSKAIESNIDEVVRLTPNIYEKWDFILFSCDNIGTIICEYNLSDSNLYLWLYTSLPSYELKNFKCSIELTDPQTKHSKILIPLTNYKFKSETLKYGVILSNFEDWGIDKKMDKFPSWEDIGIDVKVNIDKI